MELVHEFSFTAMLKPPIDMGAGPHGPRMYAEVIGGEVVGDRLKGKVLTGGGDWLVLAPDGHAHLDVRAQFQTDDGAVIYAQYFGLLEFNERVQQALAADAGTDWGDQYFRTAPRLETGDARYAWVNRAVFLGEGRMLPGPGVEYRVHRVT